MTGPARHPTPGDRSGHPPGELLSGLVDGELDEPEAEVVERHIRSCGDCAETLSGFGKLRASVRALPPVALPAGYEDDLVAEMATLMKADPARDRSDLHARPTWVRRGRPAVSGWGRRTDRQPIGSHRRSAVLSGVGAAATVGAVAVAAALVVVVVRPHDTPAPPRVGRMIATLAAVRSGATVDQAGLAVNMGLPAPAASHRANPLNAPYVAPASLSSGYRRVGLVRGADGLVVNYDDGEHVLSLLEEPGSLSRRAIPAGGSVVMVGTHPGIEWSGLPNRVVMWQDGSAVYTVVGNGSLADVLLAASDLPTPPSISWSQRMRRGCRRLVTDLAER